MKLLFGANTLLVLGNENLLKFVSRILRFGIYLNVVVFIS